MPAPLSHHPEPRAPLTKDIAAAVRRIAPVAAFLLMALWSWRVADPIQALPNDPGRSPMGYGDVLEVTWGLQWYYDAVIARAHDLDLYPGIFAPDGWQVGTLAHGPGLFLAGLPWVALGGVALAYNASLWIAMVATYVGVYRLALRKLDWPWALAAAVFIAFWSYRWMRIGGQPNLLLGAAVLPWLAGCLEHGRSSSVRPWIAVVMGGALWAFAILCSLYFIWLGAVTIGAWGLGLWLHDPASRRRLG
ncbi:MAG: hypothetical protein JNL73_16155 [Anaerolineales bacterium]|nr:hypothetical protein [Anaerolineales bacterium]